MATPLSDTCTQGIVLSKFADMVDCALAREDALRALARRLETERDALASALRELIANRDSNCFEQEKFVHTEHGDYWSPSASMVDSHAVAQARAALAALDKS